MLRRAGDRAVPGTDLGTARFETFLRRLFSVKGPVAPAIEPKLQAGIELLTPPWELGDAALLMGWRGFEAYSSVGAGGAGNFSVHELRPATGIIALVEQVTFYSPVVGHATVGIRDSRPAGTAAVTNVVSLDSRYGSVPATTPRPACVSYSGFNNTATSPLGNAWLLPAGGESVVVRGPWVLTFANTSSVFSVLDFVANEDLQSAIRWWERAVEPSELAAR